MLELLAYNVPTAGTKPSSLFSILWAGFSVSDFSGNTITPPRYRSGHAIANNIHTSAQAPLSVCYVVTRHSTSLCRVMLSFNFILIVHAIICDVCSGLRIEKLSMEGLRKRVLLYQSNMGQRHVMKQARLKDEGCDTRAWGAVNAQSKPALRHKAV